MLTRLLRLLSPPPVSVHLAAEVGGYTAGLTSYRFGQTSAWVAWFADAVSGAGRAQSDLVAEVHQIRAGWQTRLAAHHRVRALRADAVAWRVLTLLPRRLVLTAPVVADALGVTGKAARESLRTLTDAGVLTRLRLRRTLRARPTRTPVREHGTAGSGRVQPAAPLTRPHPPPGRIVRRRFQPPVTSVHHSRQTPRLHLPRAPAGRGMCDISAHVCRGPRISGSGDDVAGSRRSCVEAEGVRSVHASWGVSSVGRTVGGVPAG
jgi:hypothetical protein